jgi:hypothetical protein
MVHLHNRKKLNAVEQLILQIYEIKSCPPNKLKAGVRLPVSSGH